MSLVIRQIDKSEHRAFVELPYRLYAENKNWVPPLKSEVHDLLDSSKNPWFEHAEAQLFIAERDDVVVGRVSAHIDQLALLQPSELGMGPQTGNWGFLEAEDSKIAGALLKAAEDWLFQKGMIRSLGPISFAMWDEPGLLVSGFETPPTIMMGYHNSLYDGWVKEAQYRPIQDLHTFEIKIDKGFPELPNRIVAMGERNKSIVIRKVEKRRFDQEAELILHILNDAWSQNWGFVPFTESEISYGAKKLKPLVREDLIRIAEIDGEPVAFMVALPDINEKLKGFGGSLFPFGWAKLLWWLRMPNTKRMRVPLMGVVSRLQSSKIASQLAFMLIEYIRRDAVEKYNTELGEFGWVVASNNSMRSVAGAVGGEINKVYRIYEKVL